MRDPHAVLGIERSAGKTEIKAAYRTLVKRWHPDRHGDNPAARERFLEISEAYALLTRTDGRTGSVASRERARARRPEPKPRPDAAGGGEEVQSDAEMMERIFGVTPQRAKVEDAPSLEPEIESRVAEQEPPARPEVRAQAAAPAPHKRMMRAALNALFTRRTGRSEPIDAAPEVKRQTSQICCANVPLEVVLNGGVVEIAIDDGRTLSVAVERGMADGAIVTVPAGEDGDETTVATRHAFSDILWSSGPDVHTVLGIGLETAVLGGIKTFETLDGTIRVTVPAWSTSDKVLKVGGRGLPKPDGARGDLFIHLRILLEASPDPKLVDLMSARRNGLYI